MNGRASHNPRRQGNRLFSPRHDPPSSLKCETPLSLTSPLAPGLRIIERATTTTRNHDPTQLMSGTLTRRCIAWRLWRGCPGQRRGTLSSHPITIVNCTTPWHSSALARWFKRDSRALSLSLSREHMSSTGSIYCLRAAIVHHRIRTTNHEEPSFPAMAISSHFSREYHTTRARSWLGECAIIIDTVNKRKKPLEG